MRQVSLLGREVGTDDVAAGTIHVDGVRKYCPWWIKTSVNGRRSGLWSSVRRDTDSRTGVEKRITFDGHRQPEADCARVG